MNSGCRLDDQVRRYLDDNTSRVSAVVPPSFRIDVSHQLITDRTHHKLSWLVLVSALRGESHIGEPRIPRSAVRHEWPGEIDRVHLDDNIRIPGGLQLPRPSRRHPFAPNATHPSRHRRRDLAEATEATMTHDRPLAVPIPCVEFGFPSRYANPVHVDIHRACQHDRRHRRDPSSVVHVNRYSNGPCQGKQQHASHRPPPSPRRWYALAIGPDDRTALGTSIGGEVRHVVTALPAHRRIGDARTTQKPRRTSHSQDHDRKRDPVSVWIGLNEQAHNPVRHTSHSQAVW